MKTIRNFHFSSALLCREPFVQTSRLLFVGLAIVASSLMSGHAGGAVTLDPIAWGLSPGDTFRMVVITNGGTPATSGDIADYDAFVNSQGLTGITYGGSSLAWQAIGLTPTSNPKTDPTRFSSMADSTITVNLNGAVVSNTISGNRFWKGTGYNQHLGAIDYAIDGSGNLSQKSGSTRVWTGFEFDGNPGSERNYDARYPFYQTGTVTSALGTSSTYNAAVYDDEYMEMVGVTPMTMYPALGRAGASANGWASLGTGTPMSESYPMYAISELITVAAVPEPSSTGLLAISATVVGLMRRRRKH